jgi:hypothetical protein
VLHRHLYLHGEEELLCPRPRLSSPTPVTIVLAYPGTAIGHAHCTDAGEPSGRPPGAGRARGSGQRCAGDTLLYGTKLGTGGLVRAYSDAVRLVVEAAPRAEKVLGHTVMLGFSYIYVERIRRLVAAQHGEILDEDFAAEVTLTARFAVERFAPFQQALLELSNGTLQAEIVETKEVLMPVTPGSG